MKLVAAYLLAALNGKQPDEKAVLAILSSVGIEGDAAQVKKLVEELNGKNLDEIIAKGQAKLSTVSAAAAPAAGGAAPAKGDDKKPAAGKKEEKKEEKKKEPEPAEGGEEDMGFGLFD
eukprot:Mycagemm_TRINITY_DN10317_c2_g1::TRINITY_DN10317_c2_g1_i3::g.836::m.836 type:complete len:118 gc:universal TRINITY_DN10317_c2_g1_i3:132-485(+)